MGRLEDKHSNAVRRLLGRRATHLANNHLHLTIMPTEKCNFRCTYCYEDFALPKMPQWVVREIKGLLESRAPNLDQLLLAWFGGEPLLAFDVVEDIQMFAQALSRRYPALRVYGEITTNAFHLGKARFERLLGLGVTRYQITLDGPREWHDRKRLQAGGQGTFDRIWHNLEALRSVNDDFEILLRLHVDLENHQAMRQLVQAIAEAFGGDSRFRIFLRKLSRLGGAYDADLPILTGEAGEQVVAELRDFAASLGLPLHVPTQTGMAVCYAAAANAFVVRANGEVSKCTVALTHPRNIVGKLSEDGRLLLDQEKVNGWARGLLSGDSEELRCPMRGFAEPVPQKVGSFTGSVNTTSLPVLA